MALDHTQAVPIARTLADLRAAVFAWRRAGDRVALVPTKGLLHAGHLSLVELAKARANQVIVSIFVAPAQFGGPDARARRPGSEAADTEKLARQSFAGLVYAPPPEQMFPEGFSTAVRVAGVSEGLEAATRPHLFGGVATVMAKLFMQAQPDLVVMGEKDYQEFLVVQRLARDLDLPVEVIAGTTLREHDGLAMSAGNAFLTAAERKTAAWLNVVLNETAQALRDGKPVPETIQAARARLLKLGFASLDYLELRDALTLAPVTRITGQARLLGAARIGAARLTDSVTVLPKGPQTATLPMRAGA